MRLLTEHPESVNETYFQHLYAAIGFSTKLILGALVCFIHAFLPFVFASKGSEIISELHARMVVSRSRIARGPGKDSSERAAT